MDADSMDSWNSPTNHFRVISLDVARIVQSTGTCRFGYSKDSSFKAGQRSINYVLIVYSNVHSEIESLVHDRKRPWYPSAQIHNVLRVSERDYVQTGVIVRGKVHILQ